MKGMWMREAKDWATVMVAVKKGRIRLLREDRSRAFGEKRPREYLPSTLQPRPPLVHLPDHPSDMQSPTQCSNQSQSEERLGFVQKAQS